MNPENEIFNKKYISKGYSYDNFIKIFERTFKRIHIDPELLEKLEIVFNESHHVSFNSYKDLVNICKKKITYPEFYNPYYYFPHGDSCKTYYKLLLENITPKPYLSSKNDSKVISTIYDKYQNDIGFTYGENEGNHQHEIIIQIQLLLLNPTHLHNLYITFNNNINNDQNH